MAAKAKEAVIALDQGSSSSRVMAFDAGGRTLAYSQKALKMSFPRPGWVEQNPLELVKSVEQALDEVLAALKPNIDLIALGLAAQRSTVILWNARTGRPVSRALSWMDGRAADRVAKDMELQEDVHIRTGLYLTPYYSGPKIRWLLENDPKLRRLCDAGDLRMGPISTYLLWKMTRGEVYAVDPAMAQRMLLLNIKTGEWDDTLLSLFGVPRSALPEIRPTTGDWGTFKRGGRTLRVRAVLGDQQAAAYGQGSGQAGLGVLNYGTGAFFLLHAGETLHRIPGILTSIAWQKENAPRSYFLEGTVHAAGTSYDWLKNSLGLLKNTASVDAACRRSRNRIFALQAIGGLGAPRWDYQTPTAWMGLSAKSRPEDIVRGVTEALAFLIADIMHAMSHAGVEIRSLRASGGLAHIRYLLQFQADILQKPILCLKEREATALGAAAMAAESVGRAWTAHLCGGGRHFKPKMAEKKARALFKGWQIYVQTQQKLAGELRALGLLG